MANYFPLYLLIYLFPKSKRTKLIVFLFFCFVWFYFYFVLLFICFANIMHALSAGFKIKVNLRVVSRLNFVYCQRQIIQHFNSLLVVKDKLFIILSSSIKVSFILSLIFANREFF